MPSPRHIILAVAVGLLSFVAVLLLTSDRLPELSPDALAAARERWRSAAIVSYDLAIETEGTGLDLGHYRVTVRNGAVEKISRDGLATTGDGAAYTVDGLFGLLERELELATNPTAAFGAPAGYRAHLKARFDEHGVPLQFRRVVGGTNRWAEWRVTELTVR